MRNPTKLLLFTLAALLVPAAVASAAVEDSGSTIGIFGDTPYGATQVANFPKDIDDLNNDPDVDSTVHVGDIKSGSTLCSDGYFGFVKQQFDRLKDPLVYTPGDNEWTDCHRPNNGAYDPLERLAKIREVFFPVPGRTLGKPVKITTQSWKGLPENRLWTVHHTVLATIHVVGSNDSLAPWTGLTAPTVAQQAEHDARLAGNLQWIKKTFTTARSTDASTVVLATQADMWDGVNPAFTPVVEEIAKQARWFGKDVLLIVGDSHVPKVDQPLATKSPLYPNAVTAPNLTRVVVQGSTELPRQWVKLDVPASASSPVTWTNVPFTAQGTVLP